MEDTYVIIWYSLFPFKFREIEGMKDVGTNFWNVGKTQEIASRYISLDNHEEVI